MRKLIKQRKPGEWLILALALGVTAIHTGLLLADEYQGSYGCGLLLRGMGRMLAVYLMITAWRLRKTAFSKAIAFSVASMLLLMCSNYIYEEYIFQALLFLLGPVCLLRLQNALQKRFRGRWAAALALALWFTAAAGASLLFCLLSLGDFYDIKFIYPLLLAQAVVTLWLSHRRFEQAELRRDALLRWWALCLVIVLWVLNEYRVDEMRYDPCWYDFVIAGLPFFLALLLQFLKGKLRSPWLSGGVFFLCSLLVFLCDLSSRHLAPSRELYYILLPLIVYSIEGAGERRSARPHILRLGYALLCGGLTFAVNERLRTVLYDLGGPAVNIPAQARVDWLAYRLAGLKSFFAGSVQPYEELLGYPGYGDHYNYIFLSEDIGAAIFGHGWWWLAVMLALVALVSVLLLKTRWTNAALNRCKNEFSLSFLLRAAINLPAALFMYSAAGVSFPFALYSMMDLLWLWLLFEKNAAPGPSGADKPSAQTLTAEG